MGYIEFPVDVPTTKKGIISLWFRVPGVTITAARAEYLAWRDTNPRPQRPSLTGIIPLAVFGPPVQIRGFQQEGRVTGTSAEIQYWSYFNDSSCSIGDPWTHFDTVPSGTTSFPHEVLNEDYYPADPSYIGIDVTGDTPALSVNLVMPSDNAPSIAGGGYIVTQTGPDVIAQVEVVGPGCSDQPEVYLGNPLRPLGCVAQATSCPVPTAATYTTTYDGTGDIRYQTRPETFRLLPQTTVDTAGYDGADPAAVACAVTPDHWHHILFSFDLTPEVVTYGQLNAAPDFNNGARTNSAAKMWLAFDDRNLTGHDLSCYWPRGYINENAMLSVTGASVAGSNVNAGTDGPYDDCFGMSNTFITVADKLTYSFKPSGIPLNVAPLGLPATSTYVDRIRQVEMAELQIFTGVSLDTGSENNRRAFISNEGRPSSIKKSAKLLGKKPEILLHGSSNWKKGKNTGSLAGDIPTDGVHVGDIEIYKPNPNLYGKQGT